MKRLMFNGTNKPFALAVSVLLLSIANQALAIDLTAFGRACLKQEHQLDDLKQTIDDEDFVNGLSNKKQGSVLADLSSYHNELTRLEKSLRECQSTDPNGVYCHKIRIRYNRIVVLLDKAEDRYKDDQDSGYDKRKLYIKKQQYHDAYSQFLDTCRNSNTHYQFVRDPNAYHSVCSGNEAKTTQTCALF